jgi:hypothetical protein
MVPEEHVDHAPHGRSFFLEADEEVEYILGIGAPVHDIAELDEMGLTRDPVELLVEDADSRLTEDEDEPVVIAMEVGDGHDAIDARPNIRDFGGGGEAEEEDD